MKMNHKPYITFEDTKEMITYSDIQEIDGQPSIYVYYERPNHDRSGFDSFTFLYPQNRFTSIIGYSDAEIENLQPRLQLNGKRLLEWSIEDKEMM